MFELHQTLKFSHSDDEEDHQQFVFVHNLIMVDYLLASDEELTKVFADPNGSMMEENHIQFHFHWLFPIVVFYV